MAIGFDMASNRDFPCSGRFLGDSVQVTSRRFLLVMFCCSERRTIRDLTTDSPGLLLKHVQNCFSKFVFWCLTCGQSGIQPQTVHRCSFYPSQNCFSSFGFWELNAGQSSPQPRTVWDLTHRQSGLPSADSPGLCRLCCFISFF